MTEKYLWVTNGGCPRCDAMDGYHFFLEPTRPHDYCDCDIDLVERDDTDECYTIEVNVENLAWDTAENMDPSHPIEIEYNFTIECWHGGGMSGKETEDFDADDVFLFNGSVDRGPDGWPVIDHGGLEDAIRESLIEVAEKICHCNDMPPVDDLVS